MDRLEAEMEKEEIEDTDLIAAIMMILDERAPVPVPQENPEDSLKRFRAQYAPILEEDLDDRKPHVTVHRAMRVAVAVCLCVVMSIAVAQTCGINLIANFLEWREETFVLRGGGASGRMELEDAPEGEFSSMPEALYAYGVSGSIVPSWIPARFEIQYVKAKEQLYSVSLTAVYKAKDSDEEVVVKVYLIRVTTAQMFMRSIRTPRGFRMYPMELNSLLLIITTNVRHPGLWANVYAV